MKGHMVEVWNEVLLAGGGGDGKDVVNCKV